MEPINLRWSPHRGFFVVPSDEIVANATDHRPQPFYLKGEKLADPDLFNAAAMDRDWPRLRVEHHQERLRDALIHLKYSGDNISNVQAGRIFIALTDLMDRGITPQECIDILERCR